MDTISARLTSQYLRWQPKVTCAAIPLHPTSRPGSRFAGVTGCCCRPNFARPQTRPWTRSSVSAWPCGEGPKKTAFCCTSTATGSPGKALGAAPAGSVLPCGRGTRALPGGWQHTDPHLSGQANGQRRDVGVQQGLHAVPACLHLRHPDMGRLPNHLCLRLLGYRPPFSPPPFPSLPLSVPLSRK
jgi:hypothetical protein